VTRWSLRRGRPRLPDERRDRLGRRREIVVVLAAKLVRLRTEPELVAETERWCVGWRVTRSETAAATRFARAIVHLQLQVLDLVQQGQEAQALAVAERLRARLRRW
jgi:hypothetical protein